MYNYEQEKSKIFTDEGQKEFLKIRDFVKELLSTSGAFMSGKVMNKICGDSWFILACLDRLVELNEIKELSDKNNTFGQSRIFIEIDS